MKKRILCCIMSALFLTLGVQSINQFSIPAQAAATTRSANPVDYKWKASFSQSGSVISASVETTDNSSHTFTIRWSFFGSYNRLVKTGSMTSIHPVTSFNHTIDLGSTYWKGGVVSIMDESGTILTQDSFSN